MTHLLVVSLEAWDAVWRRNQHLVDGLLRSDPGLRVLFVEPAVDPLHTLRLGRRPSPGRGLRRAPGEWGHTDRLWLLEPTKWLPRRIDARVDQRWAQTVARSIERLAMQRPLLWVNDPMGAQLLDLLEAPALYDVTDDWAAAEREPVERERTIRREEQLLGRCAEVVVCSTDLARTKGAHRSVTLVRNGVDLAAYRETPSRPTALPPSPVALYVGTLHRDRLDVELTAATARAVTGRGTVALAGPTALSRGDVDLLTSAGVVLLGQQDRTQVPALLQHADVLLVPHLVTPFTESLDPIKLYEYAASGRPVISTPVAGFRDDRSGRVTIVEAPAFPAAVAQILAGPRITSVHLPHDEQADWSDRVERMAAVLERLATA